MQLFNASEDNALAVFNLQIYTLECIKNFTFFPLMTFIVSLSFV